MNPNTPTPPPPPVLPPDPHPATAEPAQPPVGSQYMAKHPSVNGQWQVARIVAHPERPGSVLVEFPDTSRYEMGDVELGGPVAPTQPAQPQPANQTAQVSPLNPIYQQFHQQIVSLNSQSTALFGMPLNALVTMINRLAAERESMGSGHMGNYAGMQMFTPDIDTFAAWAESYLLEVQRREAGRGAE